MFGEYNDESNTKVYALEYILDTLKAAPAAIDDVNAFKAEMDTFSAPNPYMKGDAKLSYVGMTSFGQKRQLSVPLVVNAVRQRQRSTRSSSPPSTDPYLPVQPGGPDDRPGPCFSLGRNRMEQIIANGLYLGAQYALIALGLTLIFSLMNVLNFAHGQMYVLGGFVTYTFVSQLGLPYIMGLFASAITLAIVGALIEKFLFRPVIAKSQREESTMLLAAGIAFFLDAVTLLVFGEKQRGIPKIVNGVFNWRFPADHAL